LHHHHYQWFKPRPVTEVPPELACFLPPPDVLQQFTDAQFDGSYWMPKSTSRLARLQRRSGAFGAVPLTSTSTTSTSTSTSSSPDLDQEIVCRVDSPIASSQEQQGYQGDESSQEQRSQATMHQHDNDSGHHDLGHDSMLVTHTGPCTTPSRHLYQITSVVQDDEDDDDALLVDTTIRMADAEGDGTEDWPSAFGDYDDDDQVIVGWEQVDDIGRVIGRLNTTLDGGYWQQQAADTPRAQRRRARNIRTFGFDPNEFV
jgi:hypothetical protein